jgi:LSD1 subclass zinc finger protein
MPVSFPCPGCQRPLQVPDSLAGKKVRCPGCNVVTTVPAPVEPPLAVVELAEPVAPARKGTAPWRQLDEPEYPPPRRTRRSDGTGQPPGRGRPVAGLLMGIFSILFGAVGLLGGLCGSGLSLFASMVLGLSQGGGDWGTHAPGHYFASMNRLLPGFTVVLIGSILLGLLLSAAVIVSGIGLLCRWRWARWASIAWGVVSIVFQLFGAVYFVGFVGPASDEVFLNSSVNDVPIGYLGSLPPTPTLVTIGWAVVTVAFSAALIVVMLLARGPDARRGNPTGPARRSGQDD